MTDRIEINGKYFVPRGYRRFTYVVARQGNTRNPSSIEWEPYSWHKSEASAREAARKYEFHTLILKAGYHHAVTIDGNTEVIGELTQP